VTAIGSTAERRCRLDSVARLQRQWIARVHRKDFHEKRNVETVVPLVVIDLSARASANADVSVTVADIEAWERRYGRIPARAAVFMSSEWDARIRDAKSFVNADASGAMHFPGFSPEAATFLARSRDVSGIGVDTVSLDPGIDTAYAAHKAWLATGKWGVELVAGLRSVPPSGATIFVGATKVTDATGGPVRLIAVW
jgi:kynurenine formamidase